jgi:endonuclease G
VASIAAGRRTAKFAGGMAPDAQLLIVISGGDEPTGYSHTHLAALKFIDAEATRLGKPVVVNVSQGMNAGAHDGQSPLEIAFDEFSKSGTLEGRVVVKSAGNERSKNGHALVTVPSGGADQLVWRCPPGPAEVRIEVWWEGFNEYKFQLHSPSGGSSEWVDRNNPLVEEYFKGHGPYVMELVPNHPHNGHNLLKLTVDNGVSPLASNDWKLTVEAVDVPDEAALHAWVRTSRRPAGD